MLTFLHRNASETVILNANHLLDRDALAVGDARRYPRPRLLFQEFQHTPGRPFVALVGPRGTGKTVMLRQLRARTKDALFVSADTLDRGDRLVDLVRLFLDRYGVQAFFVDEIHYLRRLRRRTQGDLRLPAGAHLVHQLRGRFALRLGC